MGHIPMRFLRFGCIPPGKFLGLVACMRWRSRRVGGIVGRGLDGGSRAARGRWRGNETHGCIESAINIDDLNADGEALLAEDHVRLHRKGGVEDEVGLCMNSDDISKDPSWCLDITSIRLSAFSACHASSRAHLCEACSGSRRPAWQGRSARTPALYPAQAAKEECGTRRGSYVGSVVCLSWNRA